MSLEYRRICTCHRRHTTHPTDLDPSHSVRTASRGPAAPAGRARPVRHGGRRGWSPRGARPPRPAWTTARSARGSRRGSPLRRPGSGACRADQVPLGREFRRLGREERQGLGDAVARQRLITVAGQQDLQQVGRGSANGDDLRRAGRQGSLDRLHGDRMHGRHFRLESADRGSRTGRSTAPIRA